MPKVKLSDLEKLKEFETPQGFTVSIYIIPETGALVKRVDSFTDDAWGVSHPFTTWAMDSYWREVEVVE